LLAKADLLEVLEDSSRTLRSQTKKRVGGHKRHVRRSTEKFVFAAMPYSEQYDDTFLVAMQPAAIVAGAICQRVDHDGRSGDVVQQIKEMIKASILCIADLSESRPNVCYEAGFAGALGKPVIQICSTDVNNLPFILRNNSTFKSKIGQTIKLRKKLEVELKKYI
jgi:hypothetical protein